MEKDLIPQKYKVLSGSWLKLIALITMFIDHTASVLLSHGNSPILLSISGHTLSLYSAMRMIGRFAFPIYCFLIVEGFIHTHNRKKYGINLLVFAFISEIPWNLEHTGKIIDLGSRNVFFTLFFGYLGLCMLEKYKDKLCFQALWLVGLLLVSAFAGCDYGSKGFALIITLYVLKESPVLKGVIGFAVLKGQLATLIPFGAMFLYNGKRGFIKGKFMKYLFYVAYPLHMLILYYIKKKYIGY